MLGFVMSGDNFYFGNYLPFTLGMEHYLLIGMIIAWKKKDKGFFKDWVPFIILIMVYNMMRGIADNLNHINTIPIYDLELKLFGWMFGGQVPAFWAQQHQIEFITIFFSVCYALHPFSPLVLGIVIYYKDKDRETFKEFSTAFLLTSYLALITFALFPVAPPWYVWNGGSGYPYFAQPQQKTGLAKSAANLVDFDNYFKTNVFGDFYKTFNTNPYAAMPSLHSAYSFITAYYCIRKYGKKMWPMIFYPITIWCAAVYLNHHYICDLIGGVLYSYASIRIVRFLRSRGSKKIAEDESEEEPEGLKNLDQSYLKEFEGSNGNGNGNGSDILKAKPELSEKDPHS